MKTYPISSTELMNHYKEIGLFRYIKECWGEYYYEVGEESEFPTSQEYKMFIKHLKGDQRFYVRKETDDGCKLTYYLTKRKYK